MNLKTRNHYFCEKSEDQYYAEALSVIRSCRKHNRVFSIFVAMDDTTYAHNFFRYRKENAKKEETLDSGSVDK